MKLISLVKHLRRQREWSLKTFGPPRGIAGVLDHIKKELVEVRDAPQDVTEWIDIVILAFDGAMRAGHSPESIAQALIDKQTKNEGRKWPDWRAVPEGKAIEHIDDGEDS